MKEQFEILTELKKVEDKVHRLDIELQKIPAELKNLEDVLNVKKEAYLKIKNAFDDNEKKQRSAELDLKEKEAALKKAEAKMMEVKTNEEYQAAAKENENQKKEKARFEETVLNLITQVEQEKTAVKAAEKIFKEEEAKFLSEKTIFDEEKKKLMVHFEEMSGKLQGIKKTLRPEIIAMYDRIAPRAEGQVIAFAERGMCLGCNVRIQPQLYNEILGFKAVHRCNNCGRILILDRVNEKNE